MKITQLALVVLAWASVAIGAALIYPPAGLITLGGLVLFDLYFSQKGP